MRHALGILWLILLSGCGTLYSLSDPPGGYRTYCGVRRDILYDRPINNLIGPLIPTFLLFDLPLSFALDTALLPFTLGMDLVGAFVDQSRGIVTLRPDHGSYGPGTLAFSGDGRWLISADGRVVIWATSSADPEETEEVASFWGTCDPVAAGQDLWVMGYSLGVDPGTGSTCVLALGTFRGREGPTRVARLELAELPTAAGFSPDGASLVVGSDDGSALLFTIDRTPEGAVRAVERSRLGELEVPGRRPPEWGDPGDRRVLCVRLTDDSGGAALRAVLVHQNGTVRIWEPARAPPAVTARFDLPERVHRVAVSRDGRLLVASDGERVILRRLTERGAPGFQLPGEVAEDCCVAVSPDGKWIVAGTWGKILLWEIDEHGRSQLRKSPRVEMPGLVISAQFSPDGACLALGFGAVNKTVQLFRFAELVGRDSE